MNTRLNQNLTDHGPTVEAEAVGISPEAVDTYPQSSVWSRALSLAAVVAVSALIGLTVWLSTNPEQASRGRRLAAHLEALEAGNKVLQAEVDRLQVEIKDLKQGGPSIERYAHGNLGMIRPGERVYQFVERSPSKKRPRKSSDTHVRSKRQGRSGHARTGREQP
ncbi:MAG: FtsB family cell division protein [Bradymonadia bacterium]